MNNFFDIYLIATFIIIATTFLIALFFGMLSAASWLKSVTWNLPKDRLMFSKFAFWRSLFVKFTIISLIIYFCTA